MNNELKKQITDDFQQYAHDYFPVAWDHNQIYEKVFEKVWGRLHNILHPDFHYEFLRYLIVELSKHYLINIDELVKNATTEEWDVINKYK